MAILNPVFSPVNGPVSIALPRKQKNLTQQDFYAAQQGATSPVDNGINAQQQQQGYEGGQQPLTGAYFATQLDKYANAPAPPALEPGARVKQPDKTTSDPGNFQGYYDMLRSIVDSGNQQEAASASRAAYQRMQQNQAVASQPTGAVGSTATGSYVGSVPSNPKANFQYAQNIAGQYGWGADQLAAWYRLGMMESGWNNNAQNPHSTAYGIGQFLNSTWGGYGVAKTSDPALQVKAMANYIKARYGTPANAVAFHLKNNWY